MSTILDEIKILDEFREEKKLYQVNYSSNEVFTHIGTFQNFHLKHHLRLTLFKVYKNVKGIICYKREVVQQIADSTHAS